MKLLTLILLSFVFTCKKTPDGYDEIGPFIFQDSCVASHTENRRMYQRVGQVTVPRNRKVSVCDESITVKRYLKPNEVKQ